MPSAATDTQRALSEEANSQAVARLMLRFPTSSGAGSRARINGGNLAMIVERRYSKRYPVDFGVKFRYRDLCSCASQALDLSLEGMQLATGFASPPAGGFVEILFSLGDRTWTIPAVVTHSTPGRMGVMFREAQPGLYQAMRPRSEAEYFSTTASRATH